MSNPQFHTKEECEETRQRAFFTTILCEDCGMTTADRICHNCSNMELAERIEALEHQVRNLSAHVLPLL